MIIHSTQCIQTDISGIPIIRFHGWVQFWVWINSTFLVSKFKLYRTFEGLLSSSETIIGINLLGVDLKGSACSGVQLV